MSHPGVWGRTIVTLTGMSSLRHPSRLSGIPHVIPASPTSPRHPLTSSRHPPRHPGIPHVTPASPTSSRHPPRHPGIPHVIPASPTSSRHPPRHPGIPHVTPASPTSPRHPPRHPGIPHVTPASPRHSGIPLSFRHPPVIPTGEATWIPAFAGKTEGVPTLLPLPGESRGPRPLHTSAVSVVGRSGELTRCPWEFGYVDSGFRRNDGRDAGVTGGVAVAIRLELTCCPWELGYVDSGFRRNDGGGAE